MPTWKLELEYEGTRYRGWQIQHNAKTVQGELQDAANLRIGQRVDEDVDPAELRDGLVDEALAGEPVVHAAEDESFAR